MDKKTLEVIEEVKNYGGYMYDKGYCSAIEVLATEIKRLLNQKGRITVKQIVEHMDLAHKVAKMSLEKSERMFHHD